MIREVDSLLLNSKIRMVVRPFVIGFHVYSMDWSAYRIVMHIDGKTYATFEKKAGDKEAEWPFDKPFYLILNLAIGGAWGGHKGIDDAAFPQRMELDYVRVYQKK